MHAGQLWRTRLWILGIAISLWGAAIPRIGFAEKIEAEKIPAPQSRFQRTARYLQTADPQLRSAFAVTALAKMADAYAVEARLARQQGGARRDQHLGTWSATVDRYASQMPLLIDDIELGLPVHFAIGEEKSLAITVGDRTVIVSHPRLNEQSVFEQNILKDFCSRYNCEQFSPRDASSEPIPVSTAQVRPNWNFTEQGSNCSHSGITVHFDRAENMANARLICEQFLQEVVTLTDELAWQQRHEVSIEWDQLQIDAAPGRPEHMVRLNAAGDAILVTVPLLYRSRGLLAQVLPWIRQRLGGQSAPELQLEAVQFGWQKP